MSDHAHAHAHEWERSIDKIRLSQILHIDTLTPASALDAFLCAYASAHMIDDSAYSVTTDLVNKDFLRSASLSRTIFSERFFFAECAIVALVALRKGKYYVIEEVAASILHHFFGSSTQADLLRAAKIYDRRKKREKK